MELMMRHVNLGFDPENLERMVERFVMKGVQGVEDLAGLPTKAVETLDMFQKSQLKLGGDFGVTPKTVKAVNYLVRNAILTAIATALFLGACLLASAAVGAGNQPMLVASYIFGGTGFVLMVHLFFTVRKDG
jgi:hypothetical protein